MNTDATVDRLNTLFTTAVTAYGDGRNGRVTSDDDVLDLDLAVPRELGGAGGDLTNPEQLFAAGYAACFHSALKRACREAGVDAAGSSVTATVGIGRLGEGYSLEVDLHVALPAAAESQAHDAVEQAHATCPYSHATQGNIRVTSTVMPAAAPHRAE